jgi:dUTP pyrophosphatase
MRGFKAMNESFKDLLPQRGTLYSAGYDLKARMDDTIPAGQWMLIKTGVTAYMLPDEELQIRPRSGLALKHGLMVLNAPGTVDADYFPNEIGVILYNAGNERIDIKRGDRIAQAVFSKYLLTDNDSPVNKERKAGFGHTGV